MPDTTHELLKLRAGQINGCSGCVDSFPELKAASEPDERTFMVSACRASTYFTDAERAALALTKAVTRLALRPDPVPDEVWDEAARHYDEAQLGALVLSIALLNSWDRINVGPGRSPAGGSRNTSARSRLKRRRNAPPPLARHPSAVTPSWAALSELLAT